MFRPPYGDAFPFAVLSESKLNESTALFHPDEVALIATNRSKKRQKEFLLGRRAAHQALREFGCDKFEPILQGEEGEPLWPKGVIGSISHSHEMAVCLVGDAKIVQGIGVDVQSTNKTCREDIAKRICTENEQEWIKGFSRDEQNNVLLTLFSAKESFFKALHPIVKVPIGFQDVEFQGGAWPSAFEATLQRDFVPSFSQGFQTTVSIQRTEKVALTSVLLLLTQRQTGEQPLPSE